MGILFKLLFLLSFSKRTYAAPISARNNNYCIDDVYRYMDQKFQAANHITKQFRVAGSTGMSWYFYVVVDFCSGYFVMDMGYKDSSICTNPQYGSRTQTFDRVYATDGCKNFLPQDDFPILAYP